MLATKSLNYNLFESDAGQLSFNYLWETIKDTPYSGDVSRGFQAVSADGQQASGTYVKRTPTSIAQFNAQKQSFEDITFYVYQRIPFQVFYAEGLVQVVGNSVQSAAFRSIFREIFKGISISIRPVAVTPGSIISWFRGSGTRYSIEQMTIANFRHREGIIGTYSLRVGSSDLIPSLLREYEGDITRATIHGTTPEVGDFSIVITNSGTVRVGYFEEYESQVVNLVKRIVESTVLAERK